MLIMTDASNGCRHGFGLGPFGFGFRIGFRLGIGLLLPGFRTMVGDIHDRLFDQIDDLAQQIVEQEKELAEQKDSAEHSSVKASLSANLLKRGNLLMQMGDKDGAGKDMKRYLELNPEKVGELTGEFKAEGREHCR